MAERYSSDDEDRAGAEPAGDATPDRETWMGSDGRPALPTRRTESDAPYPPPLTNGAGFQGEQLYDEQPEPLRRPREPIARERVTVPPVGLDVATPQARAAVAGMPGLTAQVSRYRRVWVLASLVAPVVVAMLYLFLIAPDRYVTEYRFSVREPVGQASSAGTGSLAALFGGNPTPGSDLLDNYTVTDYVRSDQAARDLDARLDLRTMFGRPSDPFARLKAGVPIERLARYWRGMVSSDYDPASGLAVVRVEAFTPKDSFAIASTLVALSGDLVNSIGMRSQQDSVRFAGAAVRRAQQEVGQLRGELHGLRQSNGVIDPATGVVAGNDALTNQLRGNLAQLETQIAAVTQQLHNPDAPQIQSLREQLKATRAQLDRTGGTITRSGRGGASLTATVGRFEDVNTRLQDATQVLLTGVANYSQAQAAADAQRLYITTYARPALPESSTAPNRWLDLLIVTLVSGMICLIGLLIGNSIMEHGR